MPKEASSKSPALLTHLPSRRSTRIGGLKGRDPSSATYQEIPRKSESPSSESWDLTTEAIVPGSVSQARPKSSGRSFSKTEELQKQVSALKLALGRTKNKLEGRSEKVLDLKDENQRLKAELELMEKESDRKDELLKVARRETQQYRNWWLGEVQFMKLLLNKIPEPNKDIDLVRASQAHYLGHY